MKTLINPKTVKLMTIISLLFILTPQKSNAHGLLAYLDAGTGSLIIQLLIAFGLGISYYIKVNWKRLKAFFSTYFSKSQEGKKDDE